MTEARHKIATAKRWVVKIGSALLTNDGRGLNRSGMQSWVDQIVALQQQGHEIVLVSSGSVAEGMNRLGMSQRPDQLHQLQAAAAVGQMGLVQAYESAFAKHQKSTAQILLTHDDLSNRKRYLNARSTLTSLLDMGVIPIVNENDTVVTDEICFGDNDTLGALVANLVEADLLVILTDQDGLYTADPRHNPDAKIISLGDANDCQYQAMASGGGALGRGGMITKIRAAQLASRSAANTVIAGGRIDNILLRLQSGEVLGTLLLSNNEPLAARKQWIAGHLQTRGNLYLDAGAVTAIKAGRSSLLPIGVKRVDGRFERGDVVACYDEQQQLIAKGLVNFSDTQAQKICQVDSTEIERVLGTVSESEMIHHDNLVIF